MSDLTPAQRKAFEVLLKCGPMRPLAFARKMWPDSPGWTRHARCGPNGVSPGGGMAPAAGGVLGKLKRLFPDLFVWDRDGLYAIDKIKVRALLKETKP